jgi:Putative F0F1-ATPase subunit Ca2+/Mg2+ transporter
VEALATTVVYVYGSSVDASPDMQGNDPARSLGRSLKTLHTSVLRAGPAAAASYSLIGAILLFGGLGYACDRWLGTEPWCLVSGLLIGIVAGFYQLAKAIWRRP